MIKAILYLNTPEGARAKAIYHFDEDEYARLTEDLAGFHHTGEPQTGTYQCYTGEAEDYMSRPHKVTMVFSQIAMIG